MYSLLANPVPLSLTTILGKPLANNLHSTAIVLFASVDLTISILGGCWLTKQKLCTSEVKICTIPKRCVASVFEDPLKVFIE